MAEAVIYDIVVAVGFSFACTVSERLSAHQAEVVFRRDYNDVKNRKRKLQFGFINRKML